MQCRKINSQCLSSVGGLEDNTKARLASTKLHKSNKVDVLEGRSSNDGCPVPLDR